MSKKPETVQEWNAFFQEVVSEEFPSLQPNLDSYLKGENPAFPLALEQHMLRLARVRRLHFHKPI